MPNCQSLIPVPIAIKSPIAIGAVIRASNAPSPKSFICFTISVFTPFQDIFYSNCDLLQKIKL